MGFFKRKKSKMKFENEPRQRGRVRKVLSFMMAVPMDCLVLEDRQAMLERVNHIEGVVVQKVQDSTNGEDQLIFLHYLGEEYIVGFTVDTYECSDDYNKQHLFSKREQQAIKQGQEGLLTWLVFGESNVNSFHLQLKLLDAFVPNMAAIIDFTGEKMVSGRWVKLAVKSKVPSAVTYLYSIHAVSNQEGEVWLHTHGLTRCGGIDLEILGLTIDNFRAFESVLLSLSERIVTNSELEDEEVPIYTAQLTQDQVLITTWIGYKRALSLYPQISLGTEEDREDSHNENRGVLFCYPTEEEYRNHQFVPIDRYEKILEDNPIIYYTAEETERMRLLATERFCYLEELYQRGDEEQVILIKVGLEVDETYVQNGDEKEHLWFQADQIDSKRGVFHGTLTQEPYFIEGFHEGDEKELSFTQMTDWIVFSKQYGEITPDTVYQMKEEF